MHEAIVITSTASFRPTPPPLRRRLAQAGAESGLIVAAAAFAWPLALAVPAITGPLIALAAGLVGWTIASAATPPAPIAANDDDPWPPHRIRAVGHRPTASVAVG